MAIDDVSFLCLFALAGLVSPSPSVLLTLKLKAASGRRGESVICCRQSGFMDSPLPSSKYSKPGPRSRPFGRTLRGGNLKLERKVDWVFFMFRKASTRPASKYRYTMTRMFRN